MIQLFPLHIVAFTEYKNKTNHIKRAYWITEGERCSILDLLFWERGVAIFKLSYSYKKMISLQNVMKEIINDIITLFLFDILKLLCSYFLYIYLIFLHQRVY